MTLHIVASRRGYREYRVTGKLTVADIAIVREMDEFPEDERPGRALLDLSEMEALTLSVQDIAGAANFISDADLPPRLAIIIPSPSVFGVVRQLVQFQGVEHRVAPFPSRAAAEAWLHSAEPAPGHA